MMPSDSVIARSVRLRFAVRLIAWVVLYTASLALYDRFYLELDDWLITRMQIEPAIAVLKLTLPGIDLRGMTTSIVGGGIELSILRGCDGVEAWLLLATAFLVLPLSWRRRFVGALAGTVLIFTLNITRIVSLFHVALKRPETFDVMHGFIWQSVVTLASVVFVLFWTAPRNLESAARTAM